MNHQTQNVVTAFDETKLSNAQQHALHLQAHADFLTERQRASGIRARLCSTGCYSLYDDQGHFIGRTSPANTLSGVPASRLKTMAARMAHSEELANVCRLADLDFEKDGAVSADTINHIRQLLTTIGAA